MHIHQLYTELHHLQMKLQENKDKLKPLNQEKIRFSELNNTDNTLDGTNVDWTTAAYSLEGANAEGKVVVDGEGT